MGVGKRIKRTFNDRQEYQLCWQAAFFCFIQNVVKVTAAALSDAVDVSGMGFIPVKLRLNATFINIVIEFKARS